MRAPLVVCLELGTALASRRAELQANLDRCAQHDRHFWEQKLRQLERTQQWVRELEPIFSAELFA